MWFSLGKYKERGRTGVYMLFLFHLIVSIILLSMVTVHAQYCGEKFKRVSTAQNTNLGDKWGGYALNTPSNALLCGSSWDVGSYLHLANGIVTEGTGLNWVEVMWYFGYTDYGSSSTVKPAYQWAKFNIWDGGRRISDISRATGVYPNWGDNIKMRLYYDYTDYLGRDYYKIVIEKLEEYTITISNLWVNGRGVHHLLQSETFNPYNILRGKQYYADYMSTSKVWYDWTAYGLWRDPQSGNQLCIRPLASDSFKFGTLLSGVCSVP